MLTHEGDVARSGDCAERSNPRSGRLPVFPARNGADGFAAARSEDAERSGLPARRPVLRCRGGRRTQRARRLVVRGTARIDETGRSLDRLLERCPHRVSGAWINRDEGGRNWSPGYGLAASKADGRCDRRMIHLGDMAARSFAPCNLLSRSITASVAAINFETTPLRPAIGLRS